MTSQPNVFIKSKMGNFSSKKKKITLILCGICQLCVQNDHKNIFLIWFIHLFFYHYRKGECLRAKSTNVHLSTRLQNLHLPASSRLSGALYIAFGYPPLPFCGRCLHSPVRQSIGASGACLAPLEVNTYSSQLSEYSSGKKKKKIL